MSPAECERCPLAALMWEASIPVILCRRVIMGLCVEGVPAVLSFIQRDTLSFWCSITKVLPSLFTPSPKKRAGAWRTMFS